MNDNQCIVLHPAAVEAHWENIKRDPMNPLPECKTPEEFIRCVEGGEVQYGGMTLVIYRGLVH